MKDYVGDLLFGGFVIVLLVLFLRHPTESVHLLSGAGDTYVGSISKLSALG